MAPPPVTIIMDRKANLSDDEEDAKRPTLHMLRDIVKGSIEYNNQYDDDGSETTFRERQGKLYNFLDGIDQREPPSDPNHVSFMPRLVGMWEDNAPDEDTQGGGPIYTYPTPEQVESEARGRAEHIINDWRLLKDIVERHEATIQKRWLQKTHGKRKDILVGAWPDIASCHRPDFRDFQSTRQSSQQPNRNAYLMPYINIEDLTKPRSLLLFLNSRGRNEPSAFAEADYVSCRFGFSARALSLARLDEKVMRFIGRRTPDTYGKLYPRGCEGSPEICDWEHAEDNILPGAGLIILEIQERVYNFLVNCCKLILHDIPETALVDPTAAIPPEPQLAVHSETTLPPLAQIASETPYRLPSEFDLKRLQPIVKAKLSEAEDHVWALREDPHYFASAFWEYANHCYQLAGKSIMLDATNWAGSFKNGNERQYHVANFISGLVNHSLRVTDIWRDLDQQLNTVLRLRERSGSRKITRRNIRKDFAVAVMKLEHDLQMYLNEPTSVLRYEFFTSPPVRKLLPEGSLRYKMIVRGQGPDLKSIKDPSIQELFWIISSLQSESQRKLAGLGLLVDELGQLLDRSPVAKNCVSPRIAREISDLSVLAQCTTFVEKFYPQAVHSVNGGRFCLDFEERMKGWCEIYQVDWKDAPLPDLGDPGDGKFSYPTAEPDRPATIEAVRKAEKNLDGLWKEIDARFKEEDDMPIGLRKLITHRILHRTPKPRIALIRREEQEILEPLSELYFDREQRTERTIAQDSKAKPAPKVKVKTKGTAAAKLVAEVESVPAPPNLPRAAAGHQLG